MKIQRHTDLEVYKKAFDTAMGDLRGVEDIPKRGNLFAHRSDPTVFSVGLCQFGGGLAEASLQGGVYFETIRRGKRSGRNASLARVRYQVQLPGA
jgi:hypothetical protein